MQSDGKTNKETGVYNAGESSQNPAAPPPYPGNPGVYTQPYVIPSDVINREPTIMMGVIPVVNNQQMGYEATIYTCKSCNHQILTRVERRPTPRTHLFALCLCFIGCWPLVCFPYCMNACNNANHYCTNCGAYIGSYIS